MSKKKSRVIKETFIGDEPLEAAIDKAIKISAKRNRPVYFVYSGAGITVTESSDPDNILKQFTKAIGSSGSTCAECTKGIKLTNVRSLI